MFGFLKDYFYNCKYLTIMYQYDIDTIPDDDSDLIFEYIDDEVAILDKTIRGWYKIFPLIPLSFLIITLGYISMPAVIEILFFYDADRKSVV